jgi:hypothetical protein
MVKVSFDHVRHLSDEVGVFEHAELTERRTEHGYAGPVRPLTATPPLGAMALLHIISQVVAAAVAAVERLAKSTGIKPTPRREHDRRRADGRGLPHSLSWHRLCR